MNSEGRVVTPDGNGKILQTAKRYYWAVITSLIGIAINKFFAIFENIINEWQRELKWDFLPFIIGILFCIAAILVIFISRRYKMGTRKMEKIIPIILIFFGTILLLNGFPNRALIIHQEINFENLLRQSKMIDVQIKEPFRGVELIVESEEGSILAFPEIELEKLKSKWETEKLFIQGLEKAKNDENYYHLQKGTFRVLDSMLQELYLDENNRLRINFRNFAELEELKDNITLELWVYKTQRREK